MYHFVWGLNLLIILILYLNLITKCNNIESINLNLVIKCLLVGMGFWAMGAWFLADLRTENGSCTAVQTAEPKDYIYSVACKV